MKNKISKSVEEIKTEPSDQQLFDDKPKETQKATKTKARRKQEEMITDSEKSAISQQTVEKSSKKVLKKKSVRKQIDVAPTEVEQKEEPILKQKKGLKRNLKTEAQLLDGAVISRRIGRSCTIEKEKNIMPEKKKPTVKGSEERANKRKNSNAENVEESEPVKEVQKNKPIKKNTKMNIKLKKNAHKEVSDESEPVKKKAKAEKPTVGKRGKVVKKTSVMRKK